MLEMVLRPIPLPAGHRGCDELQVPAQDRVRRHQPGPLGKHSPAQYPLLRRQAAALFIGEPQPPATQPLPKYPVLFFEVLDPLKLAAIDPSRQKALWRRT